MAVRSGRLEKRIQLTLTVHISGLYDPSTAERTTTENVCSLGMRVLTQKARELNERLMISSLVGDLRALARVIYCQRLPDGRYGVGIQFQGQSISWPAGSMAGAAIEASAIDIVSRLMKRAGRGSRASSKGARGLAPDRKRISHESFKTDAPNRRAPGFGGRLAQRNR